MAQIDHQAEIGGIDMVEIREREDIRPADAGIIRYRFLLHFFRPQNKERIHCGHRLPQTRPDMHRDRSRDAQNEQQNGGDIHPDFFFSKKCFHSLIPLTGKRRCVISA